MAPKRLLFFLVVVVLGVFYWAYQVHHREVQVPQEALQERGAQIFFEQHCYQCHHLSQFEEARGTMGPRLDAIGLRAGERRPGMSPREYLRESLDHPEAFVVPGFLNGMPSFEKLLGKEEKEILIEWLLEQKREEDR